MNRGFGKRRRTCYACVAGGRETRVPCADDDDVVLDVCVGDVGSWLDGSEAGDAGAQAVRLGPRVSVLGGHCRHTSALGHFKDGIGVSAGRKGHTHEYHVFISLPDSRNQKEQNHGIRC